MAVMCQGHLDFDPIEQAHAITVPDYFKPELEALEALEADGLVRMAPRSVTVTPTGWHLVRAVAMVFDQHLAQRDPACFSRVA
jgi:oxygen-independent coproporphyrinogen-3 oxidase